MAHSRSTHPPVANPFSIISPQFCAHTYPVQLAIVRKVKTITDGNFVVQDINGNILFKLKAADSIFHDRHVLIDAYGNPIVTLRDKIRSIHKRWQVFRGESIESSALIFSAKRASLFQSKHNVNVFLAKNTEESLCNFRIRGNWLERSSVIYAGESSTIVAKQAIQRRMFDSRSKEVGQNDLVLFMLATPPQFLPRLAITWLSGLDLSL
ncbi:protein LURP-one-related 10-like [Pistacia vera]|uniref:protein LURP-one-related 10-like n=1 Tax=Pistacia vera TaxID=55513 RepID=UPI001263C33A|nr:protein LURP-one-related 10-like [Pistacia vera]